jgi:uncharacterized protein (DUF2249 family)
MPSQKNTDFVTAMIPLLAYRTNVWIYSYKFIFKSFSIFSEGNRVDIISNQDSNETLSIL